MELPGVSGAPAKAAVADIGPETLARYIAGEDSHHENVEVYSLAPMTTVANAREPWEFDVSWQDEEGGRRRVSCVMLIKAKAGQLETRLEPEFAVMRFLEGSGVPVPRPLWLDADGKTFGRPFFITERVPGAADFGLVRAAPPDGSSRRVLEHLVTVAARLHGVDPSGLEPALDAPSAADAALCQVDYWEDVFVRNRMEPWPAVDYAFAWLRKHAPRAGRVGIVHGDFRLGNFLYHEGRVTALLDWEMVHLGDPLEDIAWAYRFPWTLQPVLSLEEFVDRYNVLAPEPVDAERLNYYRILGEAKHCVISITAARSFFDRRTTNLRMADRVAMVTPFMSELMALLPDS
jgi:aminoglycoside phosphotransferase (APT) family kinase protein